MGTHYKRPTDQVCPHVLWRILTHLAHIVNGKNTYSIMQQSSRRKRATRRTAIFRLSNGPYFFFVSLLFPTFFSENALLYLLFSPKMFEVTKNCNFFPTLSEFQKSDQFNLSSNNAKVYKIVLLQL